MAKFRKGNMLNYLDECDYACITTNSFVKKDGKLVMGRGIAKQVRDSFRGIDKYFGDAIRSKDAHQRAYHLLGQKHTPKILAFQVKFNWWEEGDMTLIEDSTTSLCATASNSPDFTYFLNFPGIGNGHLKREDVLPVISQLPDNVTIWELPC